MTENRIFLLRYVGARFEEHRLPLDVLPDLSAFRDLLVSYVKVGWRATHVRRERLPKGFEKSIAFDLVNIKDGSAVPMLAWDRKTVQQFLPDFKDELETLVEDAYAKVLTLFDDANAPNANVELTSENIRALNKFASGLRPDERIEFPNSHGKDGNVIYLDRSRRKQLITRGRDSYQTQFEGIGKLLGSELDARGDIGTILINTDEHGVIRLRMAPERVRAEFDGSMDADVQFRLMIELNNSDALRSVVEVLDVDVIDAEVVTNLTRCRDRLSALRFLKDGWHDGLGKAPTATAFTTASALLARKPRMAGAYHIFPTDTGGLLFEFTHAGWDYTIEIHPGGMLEIYGVETHGAREMETEIYDVNSEAFITRFDMVTGEKQ